MNAQDNDSDLMSEDADLLTTVERVLGHQDFARHAEARSFEQFCSHLAAAAPQADPAFRDQLGRRLASLIEQRPERVSALTRLRSSVSRRRRFQMPWQAARLRLASLILAVLVAAGGAGAYLHGQSPTPVDAQTVLHRAEAASPGPNEAVHETYRVSASGGLSGTTEAWVGADATGSPTEFALTQTMFEDGHPAPGMSSRLVQTDQTFQVYDPASNTVTESSSGRPVGVMSSSPSTPVQDLEGMFVGTLVAQKLSRALESGTHPIPFQLERKTLDGVSVYALTLPDAGGQTFYFNTQSYVLEGADWVQAGRSWQARLDPASYQTMALAAVPPHTFTLNAPATARVVTLAPAAVGPKGAGHDDIITAMATACNTTAEALTAALQAGDKSMLAVCQETAPDMTVDRLVTALTAAFKSELDAQVASGAITPAQEASDLASLRAKLTRMVTGQPGTGAKGKQP